MQIKSAIEHLQGIEQYQRVNFEAINFYCNNFLRGELMRLIDEHHDIVSLTKIDSASQKWPTEQIEQFTVGLIFESDADPTLYQSWLKKVEEKNGEEPATVFISGVARRLNVDTKMLFLNQKVACDVIEEDFS